MCEVIRLSFTVNDICNETKRKNKPPEKSVTYFYTSLLELECSFQSLGDKVEQRTFYSNSIELHHELNIL